MTETPRPESNPPEPRVEDPPGPASEPLTPFASARATARLLRETAALLPFGFGAIGGIYFVEQVHLLISESSLTSVMRFQAKVNAASSLMYYGLIGLVVGHLMRAVGALIDVHVERAESASRSADRAEGRVVAALEHLTEALRRPGAVATGGTMRADAATELRLAIQDARWDHAAVLLQAFDEAHPDDPEGRRLADELAEARRSATERLLAEIDAARQVNDPDRVLDLREALGPLLDGEPLQALDLGLARWLMGLVQKRLRNIPVHADVAVLAGRVAASFAATPEGASLRAALPTLRRSAGLCARCGQPYAGVEDACPACQAAAPTPAAPATPPDPPAPGVEEPGDDEEVYEKPGPDELDGFRVDD